MKIFSVIGLTVMLLVYCSAKKDLESKIDDIFLEFNSDSKPGASVAVVKSGELIYQKGFGLANLVNKAKIEPKTNFRLASITKQFTALSILLLENAGKLSLDDKLTKFFPEFNHYADDIKIRNVLQHTSGLLDYEEFVNNEDTVQLKDKDVLQILVKQDSTYFKPGSKHRYSNSGYAVLAILVERLSHMSFAKFLEQKIFNPLDMNNSVAYEKGITRIPYRSLGYTKTDTGFVNSDQSLTSAVLGDGGIYSSTIDLLKWDHEVNSPTLLPKEKFYKVFEKGKNSKGEEFDYGFGWRLDPYKNYFRPYHTGGTSGYSNIYMKIPKLDLTIIVLINIKNYDAKGYAERVADLFIK